MGNQKNINRILRIGIIGTGVIGEDHIRRCTQYLSGIEVVALNDVDMEHAKELVESYHLSAKLYKSGEELIQAKDVDAVLVTSSAETHAEYVLACIKAGKFVFCEKPLAITVHECQEILDAEQACGKRLVQAGFMRSYDKRYQEMREIIESGKLGSVLMIHAAHRNQECPDGFTSEQVITETLIHEIDVFRWLLQDEFVSVQMRIPRQTSKADQALLDPQIAQLKMRSGIDVEVELFVNCQYGYDIHCEVVGEKGAVSLPPPVTVPVSLQEKYSRRILADWQGWFLEAYDTEMQDFIKGCLRGRLTGPDAWRGYMATFVAEACIQSQKMGNPVSISIPECPDFYKANHDGKNPAA